MRWRVGRRRSSTAGWPGGHAAASPGHGRGNGTRLSRVRDGVSGGGSVSGTNEAPKSPPAQGAGPRGHAPSGKRRAFGCSCLPRIPRTYPFQRPLVSAAVSAGNVTRRPPCAWLELCGPWGYGPGSQSAEGLRRGDRPVPSKITAERRMWTWVLSRASGQKRQGGHQLRPAQEGTSPIRLGLRTNGWPQGCGGD